MANRVHQSQASFTKDAIIATTYADDYITKGNAFQVKKRIALASGQELYLEFNIALAVGKMVYSLPIKLSTGGGLVFVDTYNATSSTGGTTLATPINLNGLSSAAAQTTVKTGVTVSGTASNVREYIVGTISTNQSSGGGSAESDTPKILDNSNPLYIKLANQESAIVYVDLGFIWYEI